MAHDDVIESIVTQIRFFFIRDGGIDYAEALIADYNASFNENCHPSADAFRLRVDPKFSFAFRFGEEDGQTLNLSSLNPIDRTGHNYLEK